MSKTMMPLLKRASSDGYRCRGTGDGGIRRKTKPVKLPEAIMAAGASTKHSAGATILNRTGIKVESDATTRVDDLTTRKELHVKLRNMRNRRNMKRGSTKNASTNDWEGGTIGSKNTNRRVDRSNRMQQGRIRSHMKRSSSIKKPWGCTWRRRRWSLNARKLSRRTSRTCR
jgi:hypothetical protein